MEGAVGAIGDACHSVPHYPLDGRSRPFGREAGNDHAIVPTIRDRQPLAIDFHLARVAEHAGRDGRRVYGKVLRSAIQRAIHGVRLDQLIEQRRELFGGELARANAEHAPLGADHCQRGPRIHGVATPDAELPVVDDRMSVRQPQSRIADALGLTLGAELPAVHAHDRERFRVLLLEIPQLRDYMDAVDSAVRPEVQQDDLPAQIRERYLPTASVDPVEVVGEAGGVDVRSGGSVIGGLR